MAIQPLDAEVRERLIDELGEHGCRAVEFLETAHVLSCGGHPAAPRWGQAVTYCLREAMTAIAAGGGRGEDEAFRSVSIPVVDAAARYRAAERFPPDAESALRDLLARVDALKRFHERQQGRHRRGLHSVMANVTGAARGSVGVDGSMDAYQDLLDRLNGAVHSNTAPVGSEGLWQECLETLQRLFLPPQTRFPELERLAGIENPTEQDRDAVVMLVASPEHLRRFLNAADSPAWLKLLSESGHLDPPDSPGGWPAHQAVGRLADSHPDEVVAWLKGMARRHMSEPTRARNVASAAAIAGPPAAGVVLDILKQHQQRRDILFLGIRAARDLPASDSGVEAFADIILNKAGWSLPTYPRPLLDQIADGVTEDNAQRRIELLCHKIRAAPDDMRLWSLRHGDFGSIADLDRRRSNDRIEALLSCLLKTLTESWQWLPVADLIELAQMLPEGADHRLRAWILASVPEVEPALCVEEIRNAIVLRDPTGDDLALVDRAVSDFESSSYTHRWQTALGNAPNIDEVGEALNAYELPEHWRRATLWSSLLPLDVRGPWAAPTQVLSSFYGPTRQLLQRRQDVLGSEGRSPFSDHELLEVDPAQAAALIADWRPAPGGWPGQARQLCGTVESVVNQDPDRWLSGSLTWIHRRGEACGVGASTRKAS